MTQEKLFAKTPEQVYAQAQAEGPFVHRVCLFSGGKDSLAVATRCRDMYDSLVHIETGTALPGVLDHVRACAEWLDKPLRVYTTPPEVFDELIVKLEGFPGPAQHNRCYNRLKERRLREMLKDLKTGHARNSRVLAISGIRRAESQRRAKRREVTREGALVFCNPLIDWSHRDLRDFMEQHNAPQSDVAAITHRSGECQCGAMAPPGEREFIASVFPEWFEERIAPLERLCAERGFEPCRWGPGRVDRGEVIEEPGALCTSCQLTIDDMQVVG